MNGAYLVFDLLLSNANDNVHRRHFSYFGFVDGLTTCAKRVLLGFHR